AYSVDVFVLTRPPPTSTLFPYTTLFRSRPGRVGGERCEQGSSVCAVGELCEQGVLDVLPVGPVPAAGPVGRAHDLREVAAEEKRSEEHTSELQSLAYLVCRLLLEKKK